MLIKKKKTLKIKNLKILRFFSIEVFKNVYKYFNVSMLFGGNSIFFNCNYNLTNLDIIDLLSRLIM